MDELCREPLGWNPNSFEPPNELADLPGDLSGIGIVPHSRMSHGQPLPRGARRGPGGDERTRWSHLDACQCAMKVPNPLEQPFVRIP